MKIDWFLVILCVVVWACLSMISSLFKVDLGNCGKSYPIDYALHTSLFCETTEKSQLR